MFWVCVYVCVWVVCVWVSASTYLCVPMRMRMRVLCAHHPHIQTDTRIDSQKHTAIHASCSMLTREGFHDSKSISGFSSKRWCAERHFSQPDITGLPTCFNLGKVIPAPSPSPPLLDYPPTRGGTYASLQTRKQLRPRNLTYAVIHTQTHTCNHAHTFTHTVSHTCTSSHTEVNTKINTLRRKDKHTLKYKYTHEKANTHTHNTKYTHEKELHQIQTRTHTVIIKQTLATYIFSQKSHPTRYPTTQVNM